MKLKHFLVIAILLLGGFITNAQESKEDIDKQAQTLFRKGEFVEATPLFLRLLSLEPRNPNYNYKYGTCLLYNADKKQEAFKYLNYSIQKDSEVDAEAYYYLGRAYHLTYRFNKAIKNYEIYKQKAGAKALANLQVDRQIEMCKNGKTQFSDFTETIVLEKTKIDLNSFFRIYDLTDIGGVLIVTAEFQTKQDKKYNHIPLIHFPVNSDYIYYSSYGQSSDNKDIYFRYRTSDGGWSKESPILGDVNTPYNEDFPYMHPNGKYLYFSSEGHNSMGGYDIFRSVYNPATNSFGVPENMNIAVSSPDNDFLYIVDSLEKHAYFASQRESESKNVHVYKVRLERMPMQMIVLKGNFNSSINPSQKSVSIKVNDLAGDLVGNFKTNTEGEYIIKLPKKGKYEFIVKVDKSEKEHREKIDIPELKSFRPLKQKISEIDKDGQNLIVFNNLFNETTGGYDETLAEAIESKAKMEVNKSLFNIDSLDRIKDQQRSFDQVGLSAYTNTEIQDLIRTKFKDLYTRQSSTDSLIQKSRFIVQTGNESIKKAIKAADSLAKLSEENPNDSQVEKWNRIAEQQIDKSKEIEKEMLNAQIILSFLEKDYIEKERLLTASKSLNDDIKNLSTSNTEELVKVLTKHSAFVSEELLVRTKTNAYFEYLAVINDQLRLRDNLMVRKDSLQREEKATAIQLEKLKRDYEAASGRARQDMSFEVSKAEIRLEGLRNEIQYTTQEIAEKGKVAEQKEILAQINRSPIKEDMISQHDLAEEFENLKKEIQEIENKANALPEKEEIAVVAEQNNTPEENNINEVVKSEPENQETEANSTELASTNESGGSANEVKETEETIENTAETANTVVVPTLFVIDPDYAKDITLIESEILAGTAKKSDLVARKSQAITKIQDSKSIVNEQKAENPNDLSLDKTLRSLDNLELKLSNEIAEIQTLINEESGLIAEVKETESKQEEGTATINKSDSNASENLANQETITKDENETTELGEEEIAVENREEREKENVEEKIEEKIAPISIPTLADIDSGYEQDIAQLEAKIKAGTSEKKELLKRKNQAVIKVQEAIDSAIERQVDQPNNAELSNVVDELNKIEKTLYKEIDILEDEITLEDQLIAESASTETNQGIDSSELTEINSEIAENETAESELAEIENESIDQNTIASTPTALFSEIEPNFAKEIALLEEGVKQGTVEKSKLIKRRYQAALKVHDTKEKTIALKADNPDDQLLDKKIEALITLENDIYKEIGILEDEIAEEVQMQAAEESTIASTDSVEAEREAESKISSNATITAISDIDTEYNKDMAELEKEIQAGTKNKDELVKRKYDAIQQVLNSKEMILEQSVQEPENSQHATSLKNIAEIENQLINEIETLENEIAQEAEMITAAQSQEAAEEVEAANLETRDTASIQSPAETNEVAEAIENEATQEAEMIAAAQSQEATEEVEPVSNPTDLLLEIDPNYLKDIAQIEEDIKAGTETNKQLIKRKYKVLIMVGDVKTETLKADDQNPSPRLKQKVEILSQIENQITSEIEVLEEVELLASKQNLEEKDLVAEHSVDIISRTSITKGVQSLLTDNEQNVINDLFSKKEQLQKDLENNPALAEDKKHQKKIDKIDKTIATEVSIALQNSIVSNYPTLIKKSERLSKNNPEELSSLNSQQSIVKIEQLIQKAGKQDSPVEVYALFQEAFEEQERALKLIDDANTQERINNHIKSITKEQNLDNIDAESVALTEDEIISEQNQINLKLVNLNEQINELNAMIPSTNKKGVKLIEYNIDQLSQIKMGLENKYYTNNRALEEKESLRKADANKGISTEAIKNTLTYKEEVEIAQSKEYIDQLRNNNRLTQAQYELRIKEAHLKNQQLELSSIYDEVKASKRLTDEHKEKINVQLNKISKTKKELDALRENVQSKQELVASALPSDPALRYKTENMIARDVAPLKAMPIKTASLALVKTGLVIGERAVEANTEVRPIEIIENTDQQLGGLIFRVQIGAFRNPVANTTFNEFNPISGDKIGSGWIRYVVGLFGNRETATEARDKIRTMGYSDAFVVAYCDGERIPVYRAVELLNAGACVPLINPDEDLIAETTGESPTPKRASELDESSYNKTIGAAPADIVENKSGLFFTVQVGVYNTPATLEQLNNISPLITKRLPNGQIRYSSGIFNSYDEAKPKRQEAVEKGITDAYIVAYYKGMRISVAEANEILNTQGDVALQSKIPDATHRNVLAENEPTLNFDGVQDAFINAENTKTMLVSMKRYPEFPIQELNRYNEYGELFYYDSKTKRIHSFLFDNNTINSQYRDEFSTLELFNYAYPVIDNKTPYRKNAIEYPENKMIHLEVTIDHKDLNSDLMETILNTPVLRQMKTNKNQLTVNFYAVDIENNQQIVDRLQAVLTKLGASKITKTIKTF